MKILYHHRIASKDGQYVHVEEIINSLEKLGHIVVLVEPASVSAKRFGESSSAVAKIRKYLPGFVHEIAEFLYSVKDFFVLSRTIKREKPDAIYERYNLFFPSGVWASKRYKLPLVLEVNAPLLHERSTHGNLQCKRLAGWSEKYVWTNAHKVLPVTEVLAGFLRRSGVADSRVKVIPNGVDPGRFSALPDPENIRHSLGLENQLVLGFTGFVREWHGLDRVIELLARHKNKAWRLLIVGDGPVCSDLKQQAKRLNVSNKVLFTGVLARDQVAKYVACFDLALQPDVVGYASPLKLFEYMALGKAVLAPNRANIREVLTDGVNALLFDPAEESNFSRQLEKLCLDEHLRRKLGEAAQEEIEKSGYLWDENARKIADMIEQLIATKTPEAENGVPVDDSKF